MLEDDYLIRMIHQAALAIAQAMRKRASGREDEANQTLDAAAQATLGLSMGVLRSLDLRTLQSLLSGPAGPDVARQLVAAQLLQASAQPSDQRRAAGLFEAILGAPDTTLAEAGLSRRDVARIRDAPAASVLAAQGAEDPAQR